MQGEGKSFVSANLSVSIAMNVNKYVLLIDCDLRKPDLHRIFGIGDGSGLSDYLAGHRDLASLLQRTSVEKLSLLPGGPIPANPSELMSSERMAEMLEEVKFRYSDRLIVIDSPPPGLAAETSFLARQVDGIVLVVEYGKTPRENVEELMDIVGSEKILGTVINYLDFYVSKRYGYGKYGRYGRYGRNGTYGSGKRGKKVKG
jgi:protein-tyrosine kinase